MNGMKQPAPTDFAEETSIRVPTHPDKDGFANDMVFGNEAPETGVSRVMTIISHHEKVIHFKCVLSQLFSVNQ
jgi:hypothetical protein